MPRILAALRMIRVIVPALRLVIMLVVSVANVAAVMLSAVRRTLTIWSIIVTIRLLSHVMRLVIFHRILFIVRLACTA